VYATGGEGPQFLLLSDRANWADYEPRSPKTLDNLMEEAYGKEQGATILRAVRGAVRSEYMETWKYRSDLSFIAATSGAAQQTPVPVEEEPHHHVLLKNDFVEVIRATLQPGENTLFHTHSHDSAGFSLLSSTTTEQLLGKPEQPASTSRVGDVYAESLSNGPYTHRVLNVGYGPMDEFHVELLKRPAQPSTSAAATVAAENASARVYNWVLAPGTVAPMHTHERPYLIVAVTPLHLKMVAPDGKSQPDTVKPGDFHWVDAKVTHAFANEGSAEGQIVEIELK
jgi:quercetin dioxygenase-like cupin family protein